MLAYLLALIFPSFYIEIDFGTQTDLSLMWQTLTGINKCGVKIKLKTKKKNNISNEIHWKLWDFEK